jgi:hypothetical protein
MTLEIDWHEMMRTGTMTVPVPEDEPDPAFYLTLADWILVGVLYDHVMLAMGTAEYALIMYRAHRNPFLIRALCSLRARAPRSTPRTS